MSKRFQVERGFDPATFVHFYLTTHTKGHRMENGQENHDVPDMVSQSEAEERREPRHGTLATSRSIGSSSSTLAPLFSSPSPAPSMDFTHAEPSTPPASRLDVGHDDEANQPPSSPPPPNPSSLPPSSFSPPSSFRRGVSFAGVSTGTRSQGGSGSLEGGGPTGAEEGNAPLTPLLARSPSFRRLAAAATRARRWSAGRRKRSGSRTGRREGSQAPASPRLTLEEVINVKYEPPQTASEGGE